jgi:hypothetical protein
LSSDIETAPNLRENEQNPTSDELDVFFKADKRVQDDCRDAGRDIGELKP